MGRIVRSPGNIFGRRRTRISGIGRSPARRDKTKDAINTLDAISGGIKVFEQAANLGTLIGGGIDRAVRNKKRNAARKALEQDRAKQQEQVGTAVSEAGQALESMPRLREPDTSDAGTQQFLQSIGLSGPTLGESLSGSLMPSRALVSEEDAAARLAGLRDRSGPSSVIADMSKMSPEERSASNDLIQARARMRDLLQEEREVFRKQDAMQQAALRARADRLEEIRAMQRATAPEDVLGEVGLTQDVVRAAGDRRVRAGLTPEQVQRANAIVNAYGRMSPAQQMMVPPVGDPTDIEKPIGQRIMTQGDLAQDAMELDVARLSMPPTMSQDVAMTVSPELTQPLMVRPTATDLSKLEDVGITSQRAIDTYDPAQLVAASGFAENEQQLQSLLRAAEREATPTTFADLLSGKSVKALQSDIIKQFGKNRKKPLTEEQKLKNLKLRKEISDMSGIESRRASAEKSRAQAAKVRKQIEELDAKIKKDKEKASKNKDYLRIRRGLSKKQRAIEDQYSKYLDQYAKANSEKDPDAKKRRLDSLKSSVPLFVGDDGELVSPIASEGVFSRRLEEAGLNQRRINAIIKGRGYKSSAQVLNRISFEPAATTAVTARVEKAAGAKAESEAAKAQNKAAINAAKVRGREALIKQKRDELKKTVVNPSNRRKIERLEKDISNLETEIVDLEAEGSVLEPIDLNI
tara:strand:- start:7279 stop:9354 length:2076 start_codon:yes stop_codon:yes gene_type:complete